MPGPAKPDSRRPGRGLARALVRMTLSAVNRGIELARSSTRGLQELYEEARDEYEAEKASAHRATVTPIAEPMPGSAVERVAKPESGGRRSRRSDNGPLPADSARKGRGRPRKTAPEPAASPSSRRRRATPTGASSAAQEGRQRGRPRRAVESETGAAGARRRTAGASKASGRSAGAAPENRTSGAGEHADGSESRSSEAHASEGAGD